MNDRRKYFDIIDSIRKGDTQKVRGMIDKFGLSFCPLLDDGNQPLAVAVGKDHVEMVAYLLQKNAKVNSDREVLSPLQIAAMNNNTIIFKMLLERGATISYNNIRYNKSPIKLAVERNNIDIARLIVKHENFGKKYDQSLLCTAVKNNNLEMVSFLLEIGADVNGYEDNRSAAPIHHAVMAYNNDILQLLLAYGADVNAKDEFGETSVFRILKRGYILCNDKIAHFIPGPYFSDGKSFNILRTLLENDANINDLDIKKYSRIEYSFDNLNLETLKCMIKQIVKLKSLNAPLSTDNHKLLSFLAKYLPLDNYKKICELEMSRTITEKIPNSGISLHNILTKNIHVLALYAKNKNYETFIFSGDVSSRFPIYGSAIKLRFSKGLARKNLLEKSAQVFHNIFPVASKLLSHGVDDVFKYLDNMDLRYFLCMFQKNN